MIPVLLESGKFHTTVILIFCFSIGAKSLFTILDLQNLKYSLSYFLDFKEKINMMSQTDQTDNLNQNDIIPEEPEEEELDPRVQEELEKLNQHTDQINKLELKLEDANCLFRTLLTDSTHQLKALASKIGMHNIHL